MSHKHCYTIKPSIQWKHGNQYQKLGCNNISKFTHKEKKTSVHCKWNRFPNLLRLERGNF